MLLLLNTLDDLLDLRKNERKPLHDCFGTSPNFQTTVYRLPGVDILDSRVMGNHIMELALDNINSYRFKNKDDDTKPALRVRFQQPFELTKDSDEYTQGLQAAKEILTNDGKPSKFSRWGITELSEGRWLLLYKTENEDSAEYLFTAEITQADLDDNPLVNAGDMLVEEYLLSPLLFANRVKEGNIGLTVHGYWKRFDIGIEENKLWLRHGDRPVELNTDAFKRYLVRDDLEAHLMQYVNDAERLKAASELMWRIKFDAGYRPLPLDGEVADETTFKQATLLALAGQYVELKDRSRQSRWGRGGERFEALSILETEKCKASLLSMLKGLDDAALLAEINRVLGHRASDLTQECKFIYGKEDKEHTRLDWVLWFLAETGSFDGDHHKRWAQDQAIRVLLGADVTTQNNGFSLAGEPTAAYRAFVKAFENGGEYEYDTGIAP